MASGQPPPYPQAVYAGGQPTGPPTQNGAQPYQQAVVIQPGPNQLSFGQVPNGAYPYQQAGVIQPGPNQVSFGQVPNGAYPYQQAGIQPGPNGVSFGQAPYPPPLVTTQPVVTPQGVLVEPPSAVAATHGKKRRHRRGGRGRWCGFCYCDPCRHDPATHCGNCCDCCDSGDSGGCDCEDCHCLSVLCCCLD